MPKFMIHRIRPDGSETREPHPATRFTADVGGTTFVFAIHKHSPAPYRVSHWDSGKGVCVVLFDDVDVSMPAHARKILAGRRAIERLIASLGEAHVRNALAGAY